MNKKLIEKLIPLTKESRWICLGVMVITFAIYYLTGAYSSLDRWYEDQKWSSYQDRVADYLESEIEITVENDSARPQTAAVGIDLDVPAGVRTYIRVSGEDSCQNTTVQDLLPYAQARTRFLVRVSGGSSNDEPYRARFRLNGEIFEPFNILVTEWNPRKRFRLWATSMCLLPPGANVAIPVFVILLVAWMETCCMVKQVKQCWKETSFIIPSLVAGTVLIVVLFILPDFWYRIIVLVAFLVFTILGYACHKWQWLKEEEKEEE